MNFDLYLFVSGVAGLSVGWGLFLQAAVIVQQKKSLWAVVFKLSGTVALCLALYVGRGDVFWMIAVFFAVLIASLLVFTLARQRLLR